MRRPTLAPVVILLAVVLLLCGAYLGSYYALLKGVGTGLELYPSEEFSPVYRIHGITVHYALLPANRIDRLIRPGYWKLPTYEK